MTTAPGVVATSISAGDKVDEIAPSLIPLEPKENIKQEITIKEITPVSEIPVLTGVKIKEILPSPSIDVVEYSSSKAPLIAREISTEKTDISIKTEDSVESQYEVSSLSNSPIPNYGPSESTTKSNINDFNDQKIDSLPSKISLSTQDSINSDIYPSNIPSVTTIEASNAMLENTIVTTTTKASVIEEDDSSFFDHNPAFPPLPDDLSVLSNHGDEIVPVPSMDSEHIPSSHDHIHVISILPSTEGSTISEVSPVVTTAFISEQTSTTEKGLPTEEDINSTVETIINTNAPIKNSPMLNLRSAIPSDILNLPSSVPEIITGDVDDNDEPITESDVETSPTLATSEETSQQEAKQYDVLIKNTEGVKDSKTDFSSFSINTPNTIKTEQSESINSFESPELEQTTSSIAKSNTATEIISQPEITSEAINVEDMSTSQKIIEFTSEQIPKGIKFITKVEPSTTEKSTVTISESDKIEVSTGVEDSYMATDFTEILTTASVLPISLSETTTDNVAISNVKNDSLKNAAIVEASSLRKNNVLTDLINLVGDVASISDHTDEPEVMSVPTVVGSTSISDSEELIPVNAGYKSKNHNWNLNSITEIPIKNKNTTPNNKVKSVEIDGEDDDDSITDSPPPNDRVEPTTRRPIIDNVSDNMPNKENKTIKKDIEIITQSYVPTIQKRPTKVIMKKNSEKLELGESQTIVSPGVSSEIATEETVTEVSSQEYLTTSGYESSPIEAIDRIENNPISTSTIKSIQ